MALRTAAHTAGAVEGAVDARLDAAALWALNGPGPLDVRTGVVYAPGNPMQVLGTSATAPWAVTVGPGHVVGSKGASNGPYYSCNDATVTVNLAVPPVSNSRIDVIYAVQQDAAAIISPDGATAAVLGAVTGVAGAVPAVPAVPAGAVALAQVLIASTATAGTSGPGVTITPVFLWTVPRGVPIPCRTQAERDAITTLYDDLQVYRLDLHAPEYYNGSVWIRAAYTLATRPAGFEGQQVYLTDKLWAEIFTNGTWMATPYGKVGYAKGPSVNTDVGAGAMNLFTLAVPVTAGRSYRVTAFGQGTQGTTGPSASRFTVFDTSGIVNFNPVYNSTLTVGAWLIGGASALYTAATTKTETFTFQSQATAGLFTTPANACNILVEDIGV